MPKNSIKLDHKTGSTLASLSQKRFKDQEDGESLKKKSKLQRKKIKVVT